MVDNLDNGQLNVKLDLILSQLDSVVRTMITKDLFDTWRQGNNERLTRLEEDHKNWVRTSTEAHVSLEKDSKARHAEGTKQTDELEVALRNLIDKNRTEVFTEIKRESERNDALEEGIKNRKNANVGLAIGLIVTGAISVAGIVVTVFLNLGH